MEIKELFNILKKLAPGLIIDDFINHEGDRLKTISKVGICIDPTPPNIIKAYDNEIDVLISYHPWQGEAESVVRNGAIEIWPLHTAWDNTEHGVIYTLAKEIGILGLYQKGEIVYGVTELTFKELIELCQRALGQNILSYGGDLKLLSNKIGMWAGPGFLPNYKKFWEVCRDEGCDTIISSEITLSALRYSRARQVKIIDLGHSAMAKPGMLQLEKLLRGEPALKSCMIDFYDDFYGCNYYTNCAFADQFTEDDSFFESE